MRMPGAESLATATFASFRAAAAPDAKGTPGVNNIVVRDARNGKVLPTTGSNADIDAVNGARNAGIVLDFYRSVLGRDSIDGAAMIVELNVHQRGAEGNAYWDGRGVSFGDSDGKDFKSLAGALDAVGHELTHGVNHFSNKLVYQGQSGALDESFSDVMGEAAQMWNQYGPDAWGTVDTARKHDWSSGEDGVMGDRYKAISDLGRPERTDLVLKQPGHMKNYVTTTRDNGGVHINSGIPSKAAFEAAQRIGTEKVAKVWFDTMLTKMRPRSTFSEAAAATIESAQKLYGTETSNAVRDAWAAVGL